jgi:hypothetical protein
LQRCVEMPDPHPPPRQCLAHLRQWQHEDYDVFDSEGDVGRIYRVDGYGGTETWFWGVSFQLTGRKSYAHAASLAEAKAAFRAGYEAWKNRAG